VVDYRLANIDAMKRAITVHGELGTDMTKEIDVYAAIRAMGVDLVFLPLAELSGAYLPQSNETGGLPGIVINSNHPRSRQRYSAGHELGHHLRDGAEPTMLVDRDTDLLARQASLLKSQSEVAAEAFAAWFLMPRQLVAHLLYTFGIEDQPTPEQAYRLSLALGTSYLATVGQLHTLKVITTRLRRQLSSVTPKWIKSQLAVHGPEDSWGDVWFVTDDEGPRSCLSPRPGDEIVVKLREMPSSGYVWDVVGESGPLELIESEFEEEASPSEPTYGGEGRRRILFRAARPGHETVTLAMTRPWERHGHPERHFTLDVSVEPRIVTALQLAV
jgi:predicted secreted protein